MFYDLMGFVADNMNKLLGASPSTSKPPFFRFPMLEGQTQQPGSEIGNENLVEIF